MIGRPIQARGLTESVSATTATGAGVSVATPPTQLVALQVTHGSTAAVATAVKIEGSLDGTNWFDIGAGQTYNTATTDIYLSTGTFIASVIRANVTAHTSTGTVSASLLAV